MKSSIRMCSKVPHIKNLVKLQNIKNFKTQKFKYRTKDQFFYFYPYYIHQCNCNSLQKNQIINFELFLTQISYSLQLPIKYFKMFFQIIFILTIVTSHIVNCQAILIQNNTILLFSKNYNLSDHLYQFVKKDLVHKSLIANSTNTVENNRVKNQEFLNSTSLSNSKIDVDISWSTNSSREVIDNEEKGNIIIRVKTESQHNEQQRENIKKKNSSGFYDDQTLSELIMEGLGLTRLPDINKANISQIEYVTKYNEYLNRIHEGIFHDIQDTDSVSDKFYPKISNTSLSLISIFHNSSDKKLYRKTRSPHKEQSLFQKSIFLTFPFDIGNELQASDIVEANIRLLLIMSPALAISGKSKRRQRLQKYGDGYKNYRKHQNKQKHGKIGATKLNKTLILNMKVFQILEPKGKVWISGQKLQMELDRSKTDETISRWLQFDVTKAAEKWLNEKQRNLSFEIKCDNCFRNGARIIDDLSDDGEDNSKERDLTPVLNIVGRLGIHREKRSKYYHNQITEKPQRQYRKNNCYKDNQRCCRHTMEVVFKEIKGFEFIIQPKVFDAGYCRGRCPPRYNPAHHHALLQSLIWKKDGKKVPRPCCAPSKLIELEVLHVDEKDNEKLKISTWTDMRVLECACS